MRCYSCKAITSSQWQSHKIKHQQWGAACGNNWKPCFSCSKFPQGVGIFGRSRYISTAESKLNSREPFLSPATYLCLWMGGSSKRGRRWESSGKFLWLDRYSQHFCQVISGWDDSPLYCLFFLSISRLQTWPDSASEQRREREKKVSETSSFLLLESQKLFFMTVFPKIQHCRKLMHCWIFCEQNRIACFILFTVASLLCVCLCVCTVAQPSLSNRDTVLHLRREERCSQLIVLCKDSPGFSTG